MRTSVELPEELLRAAKVEARGETFKDFLARAVTHELGNTAALTRRARVKLPLVESARPGSVDITNAGIEAIFAAEDAEKHSGC